MPHYFYLNRSKLSLRELRQISPGLSRLPWILLYKSGLVTSLAKNPQVRPEGIRRLPFEQFPTEARQDLQPVVDAAVAAGLRLQFCYQTLPENEFNPMDSARMVAFLSEDHRLWSVLAWVRVQRSVVVRKRSAFQCRSLLASGAVLVTNNRRPLFDPPAHLSVERVVDGSPQAVVDLHLKRLQGVPPEQIVRVTEDGLEEVLLKQAQELSNELRRRGVLVPLEGRWND